MTRGRTNIIVKMSLWLVSVLTVVLSAIGWWIENKLYNSCEKEIITDMQVVTALTTRAISTYMENNENTTNDEIRNLALMLKPNSDYDITIIDTVGNCIVEPKADIAIGDDALVEKDVVPELGWTIIFTYPRHLMTQYLMHIRGVISIMILIIISLTLVTVLLIVQWVARPFVVEQRRLAEDKAVMDNEVNIAANIQRHMLPSERPNSSSILLPARNIGGDLYDIVDVDGYRYFCIGDVSGKGIPASMIMSATVQLFRHIIYDEHCTSPSQIMAFINRAIARDNTQCMFVTMFIGILHPNGKLIYCNAGHCSPILKGKFLPPAQHMPIGVFDSAEYADEEIMMSAGEVIYLYTDGVTEAMNSNGECFSDNRLIRLFADHQSPSLSDILASIKEHTHEAPQSDDITLMTIAYVPENTLYFEHARGNSATIIQEVMSAVRLSDKAQNTMRLVVEEVVVNICEYAYPPEADNDSLSITTHITEDSCQITFCDAGIPFNPLEQTPPDLDASIEDKAVGGLGIFLVQQLAQSVQYQRDGIYNQLTISISLLNE